MPRFGLRYRTYQNVFFFHLIVISRNLSSGVVQISHHYTRRNDKVSNHLYEELRHAGILQHIY
jgi:hypothetical protein